MKWFKHISDSLDDPFISDLMDQHGPIAYLVFFGTLEIYAREWKPEPDWKLEVSYRYLARKFHQSRSDLIRKCLGTISLMGKWCISEVGTKVTIYIPKFSEMIDEYTRKRVSPSDPKKPKVSGHRPDNVAQELELEVDKDKKELPSEACGEVPKAAPSPPASPVLLTVPLIPRDGHFDITQEDADQWQDTFPAVDVLAELKRLRQWSLDNPKNRKTRAGFRSHVSKWLGRTQDKAARQSPGLPLGRKAGQYDQRPDPYAGI